jgi:hypothetical protein
VDIKESTAKRAEYLEGSSTVAIERDGHVIGVYVPSPKRNEEAVSRQLEHFEERLTRFRSETRMTEEELAHLREWSGHS